MRRSPRGRPGLSSPLFSSVHASEAAGAVAQPAPPVAATSVATLLTRHILRDGEIVLLIVKPSLWSIFFSCLPVMAAGLITVLATRLWAPHHLHIAFEAALMMIGCRAALAVLSWSGRLYLLTDRRVVRIAGIFNPRIDDIPLRKVARTRLVSATHERLWRLGSIEIIPECEEWSCSIWQTIAQPREINETIRRAITRSKQGGYCPRVW